MFLRGAPSLSRFHANKQKEKKRREGIPTSYSSQPQGTCADSAPSPLAENSAAKLRKAGKGNLAECAGRGGNGFGD